VLGRAGAVVAASALLSGCWLQVGFAGDHGRNNVLERGITRDTVAGLHEAWSVELPGFVDEPVVSGGRLYLTRDTVQSSADVRALDAATGAEVWQNVVVPPLPPDPTNLVVATPVAFSGDRLWLSYAASGLGFHFASLDPADGTVLGDSSEGGQLVSTPVVTGDGVAAYVRTRISTSTTLVVRDPDTSAVTWTAGLPPLVVQDLAVARGRVVVPENAVAAFTSVGCGAATCAPVWRTLLPSGARPNRVAIASDSSVVAAGSFESTSVRDSITVLDGTTGALRWSRVVPGITDDTVAVAGDTVFVASQTVPDGTGGTVGEDALLALSLADGTTRWSSPLAANPALPLVAAGVVYTGAGGDVLAFDAAGCGAATCGPLVTLPGAGQPRSLGEGRLYTTLAAPGTVSTTLRAFVVG
jgi:outer membrane protein assembly factor BamB